MTTVNPTANQTPDPTFGGSAVTGNVNTGHGNTTSSATDLNSQTKSCRWTGFPSVSGEKSSVILKADWTENGSSEGGSRQFLCQYSLNGGSSWSNLFDHAPLGSASGTAQATLPNSQNLTQVQVRDKLEAIAPIEGLESVTGRIENIRIEVQSGSRGVLIAAG